MKAILTAVVLVCSPSLVLAQFSDSELKELHAPWGLPGGQPEGELKTLVNQGYISGFDKTESTGRVPVWVAYTVKPEFLEKDVKRKGKLSKFSPDDRVDNPVKDNEYKGWFDDRGFARGHLAPWAVMGGDRDGDGKMSKEDDDDAKTMIESNLLTNVAPQHHSGFNGSGGIWFKLERFIQDKLVKKHGKTVSIYAGCIFGPGEHEAIGPDSDIWVPAMFYKVVAWKDPGHSDPTILAFLFPHHRKAHGDIEDYLVTVDVVEAMAGVDLFNKLNNALELEIEDESTFLNWEKLSSSSPEFAE